MRLDIQIKNSISWLGLSSASLFLARLTVLLLVANAVPATSFGTYGILVAVTAFLPAAFQSTFQAKIIHAQVKDYKYNVSLHNALIKVSIAFSVVCIIFFQVVSGFAMGPGLWLPILLLTNVMKLLETVPVALLHRDLEFRAIGKIRIVKLLIFCISATCTYVYEIGIAVLIVPELLASIYGYAAALKYLRADKASTGSISYESGKKFGWSGFTANLSNYLANQSGTIYLALFFGLGPAGAFFLAKRLHDAMITLIDTIHLEGVFPIFSKKWVGGSKVNFESMVAYTNGRAALLVPILTIIFWSAEYIFSWIQSDSYSDAVLVFQFLLIPQVLRYSIFPANKIFFSIGRPSLSAQISIGRMILFGISLIIARRFDLDVFGLVVIFMCVELIILLVYQSALQKVIFLPDRIWIEILFSVILAFAVLLAPILWKWDGRLNQDQLLLIYLVSFCLLLCRFLKQYRIIFSKFIETNSGKI